MNLDDEGYRRLADLRHGQRRFLHWSAEQARRVGLTATQHQLLLGIRAHEDPLGPTITQVAEFLLLKHHSAVELVDRAEAGGLIERQRDAVNPSTVHVLLRDLGREKLEALTALHLRELAELAPTMSALWSAFSAMDGPDA